MLRLRDRWNRCWRDISVYVEKDIISEKSLRAVAMVVSFLKIHARSPQIFLETCTQTYVHLTACYIRAGDERLQILLTERTNLEIFSGLKYFLLRLRKKLIPYYIQSLALDNEQIPPEVVAADILALISQDIKKRHLILISALFDLLHHVSRHDFSDELTFSKIPFTMQHLFFNLQTEQLLLKWRNITIIFMEMIYLSSSFIPLNHEYSIAPLLPIVAQHEFNNNIMVNEDLEGRQVEVNVILRQHLVRGGFEGDANFPEIINIIRDPPVRNLRNPIFGYINRRLT